MSRASEAVLLKDHLKELRLPTMRRDYAECARQARETRASYEGFLLDLVSRQLDVNDHQDVRVFGHSPLG